MRNFIICIALLCFTHVLSAQLNRTTNPAFEQKIDDLLSETIPFIYVEQLKETELESVLILDAREWEEYEVSHIPTARYIGYENPVFNDLSDVDPDTEVIVYCSIGYRSEKIAEQLEQRGFTRVLNLYGSIFEWVNQGQTIEDMKGKSTQKIHTYNRKWSKWMINESFQKVW